MYWSNLSLLKDISLRKSFSPYLACYIKTVVGNSEIISHKEILTYGEYAWVVKKVWITSKLAMEGYCIFDK